MYHVISHYYVYKIFTGCYFREFVSYVDDSCKNLPSVTVHYGIQVLRENKITKLLGARGIRRIYVSQKFAYRMCLVCVCKGQSALVCPSVHCRYLAHVHKIAVSPIHYCLFHVYSSKVYYYLLLGVCEKLSKAWR